MPAFDPEETLAASLADDRFAATADVHEQLRFGSWSALWKALHKADYAKSSIMESN